MTSTDGDCTINYQEHWDRAFTNNPTEKLGWYEERSKQTLALIANTNLPKNSTILNIGNGSSTLIDDLIGQGYTNLIAADISVKALEKAKERLGNNEARVEFIVDDLIKPEKLNSLRNVDLWNDRAVLHFFLEENEKKAYVDLMKKVIKPKGFAIIAVFALEGHEKCSGLQLQRYSADTLQDLLINDFELKESFNYTFINPYGSERPYVYTLFQKI